MPSSRPACAQRRSRTVRVGASSAVVALVCSAALAGCADSDKEKAKQAGTADCPASVATTVAVPLPADVPSPGGHAYSATTQGKTRVWFFALDGTAPELPRLRDAYNRQLTARGYTIQRTDQESGAEAESEFTGPHEGTTNFRPLCRGTVTLRLKLTS